MMFPRLKQAFLARRKKLAERSSLLGKLDHGHEPPPPGQPSAWENLFARPEWQTVESRCPGCGVILGASERLCVRCRAGRLGRSPGKDKTWKSLFLAVSVTLAAFVGIGARELFLYFMGVTYVDAMGEATVSADFVDFLASYILISFPILFLVLSTYVFQVWNDGAAVQPHDPSDIA